MVNVFTRRAGLAVGMMLLLGAPTAGAAGKLILVGPAAAVGDGATPVLLEINAPNGQSAVDLVVESNAGKPGPITTRGPGQFMLQVLPPRVAAPTELAVSVRDGKNGGVHKHVVRLRAATFALGERRGTGDLDLRVPRRMLLGSSVAAQVSAMAPAGREVKFYASAGVFGQATRDRDGRVSASYSPPPERFPRRVVIAAATRQRDLIGYATIDLYASPGVKVKSVPNAWVRVKVGKGVFGPFRTDRAGRAVVAVHAPPGINNALVFARKAAGVERSSLVALKPPPFKAALILCPDESDQVVLISPDGNGASGAKSVRGELSAPKKLSDNVWMRGVRYTSAVQAGTRGRLSWGDASCEYAVPGEAPLGMSLSLLEREHVATARGPITIRAKLRYPGNRAARGARLDFRPSVGRIANVVRRNLKDFTADWYIPKQLHGKRSASVAVFVRGQPNLKQRAALELRPGPIASLVVKPSEPRRSSDARHTIAVKVFVEDAAGNRISKANLAGSAAGDLSAFRKSSDSYVAIYTAPAHSETKTDILRITEADSGISETVTLQVDAAGKTRPFNALVSGGYVTNFGKVNSIAGFAAFGVRPGWLDSRLILGVGGGFYRSEVTEADAAGFEEVGIKAQAVPIVARATVELSQGSFVPEIGAEGGVIVSHTEVSSESTGKHSATNVVPAISGVAGISKRLPVGRVGLMLRYTYSRVDDDAVQGNLGGLGAMAGYALDL